MIVEFKYNHNVLRVGKVVNGVETKYQLHGKLIMHMTVGEDNLHFFYDAQSRPAKISYNGVIYTYIHNLQGDIVGLLDSAGTLVVEYKYDACSMGRKLYCRIWHYGCIIVGVGPKDTIRSRMKNEE